MEDPVIQGTELRLVIYVLILKKQKYTHTHKRTSFRVRAMSLSFRFTFFSCVFILLSVSFQFLPCPLHFRQSCLCFASSYLISLFSVCFFMSFWCSSDFRLSSFHFPSHAPFMSLSFYSRHFSCLPFSSKSFCHFPCMSCHFIEPGRTFAHVGSTLTSFQFISCFPTFLSCWSCYCAFDAFISCFQAVGTAGHYLVKLVWVDLGLPHSS